MAYAPHVGLPNRRNDTREAAYANIGLNTRYMEWLCKMMIFNIKYFFPGCIGREQYINETSWRHPACRSHWQRAAACR